MQLTGTTSARQYTGRLIVGATDRDDQAVVGRWRLAKVRGIRPHPSRASVQLFACLGASHSPMAAAKLAGSKPAIGGSGVAGSSTESAHR